MKLFKRKQEPKGEAALRLAQAEALELRAYFDRRLRNGGLLLDQYEDDTRVQALVVVEEIEKLILIYGSQLSFAEVEALRQK